MKGAKAHVIRQLNILGPEKYSASDIQTLSWSIQGKLPYKQKSEDSKTIIDDILPEFKTVISKDSLTKIENN